MSALESKNAKPMLTNKSLHRIDDSDKTDKNFTFKITKKRSPWTQEVLLFNTGR